MYISLHCLLTHKLCFKFPQIRTLIALLFSSLALFVHPRIYAKWSHDFSFIIIIHVWWGKLPAYVSSPGLSQLISITCSYIKSKTGLPSSVKKLVGIFLCVIVLSFFIRFGKFDIFKKYTAYLSFYLDFL